MNNAYHVIRVIFFLSWMTIHYVYKTYEKSSFAVRTEKSKTTISSVFAQAEIFLLRMIQLSLNVLR